MNGDGIPSVARGRWKRFGLGAVSIIVLAAAAAAVPLFMEVREIASALSVNKALDLGDEITEAEAGAPQTILVLGSDKRVSVSDPLAGGARSDTIMLVRLNPKADAVTVMSIPRDLKAEIPGYGTDKINAAYEQGGPRLTLRTVKQLLDIKINHVVNVNFSGFTDITQSIDGVYVDVDRRYYNVEGAYAGIDLKPGYQRLEGEPALAYARYRQEDNDLVRAARQQEFLRQAKQQVKTSKLFDQRRKLVGIFGRYAETDKGLRSSRQLLRLLKLALFSAQKPVAQVEFPAIIPNDPRDSFLTYQRDELRAAVDAFLEGKTRYSGKPRLRSTADERRAARKRKRRPVGDAGLEEANGLGEEQAVAIGGELPYPVFFPRLRVPGSAYVDVPRVYTIKENGKRYPSYRMVLKKGAIGEYYGVQGTAWKDPPILDEPNETRKLGKRTFQIYYTGRRIRLIAWRTPRAVYWISNTLTDTIPNKQMLGMARSVRDLG
jgi:LCP family protein required for cell wall assembly